MPDVRGWDLSERSTGTRANRRLAKVELVLGQVGVAVPLEGVEPAGSREGDVLPVARCGEAGVHLRCAGKAVMRRSRMKGAVLVRAGRCETFPRRGRVSCGGGTALIRGLLDLLALTFSGCRQ
ncbi:hypothetical protein GCM10027612_45230 [Microbispora bryophytorum subsp. camponoti]